MLPNEAIVPLLAALRPLAETAPTQRMHWIGGSDNEGLDYCSECAEKEIEKLRAANPGRECSLDGGWDAFETDSGRHCEACGALLEYTLTKHGTESELDHYVRHMPRKRALLPGDAYCIVAVLEQIEWVDDKKQVARAVRMAKRAVARLAPRKSKTAEG